MKNIILIAGLFFLTLPGFGQQSFQEIDERSKTVPDSLTSYVGIAQFLTEGLATDTEKARALYIWIAHNIRYDLSQVYSGRRYSSEQEVLAEVLSNRKGVCQHYAELFLAMAREAGLNSYLVSGYARDATDNIGDLGHAWNAVKIGQEFFLIDATWAAGYELNKRYVHEFRDHYFLKSPREWIFSHIPFDPVWQFLDNPLDHGDYISRDFTKLDIPGSFAFGDSLELHERLDKLSQLVNTNNRILASEVPNLKLIQNHLQENTMQINTLKYNLAIDTLNYGIDHYNRYIFHKNRQFRNPTVDDSLVKEMLARAEGGFYTANEILSKLVCSRDELNSMITDARSEMPELLEALEQEKAFVEKYLKRWKPLRIFMFLTWA